MVKLRIFETSDMHGFVLPSNYTARGMAEPFGMARARTVMSRLAAEAAADGDIVLKIENGDILQGSALAYFLAKERPDGAEVLAGVTSRFGYDVGLLGNHEFNYGRAYLSRYVAAADYPILAANVLDAATGKPAFGAPYQLIEMQGVTIAVLGLLTQYIPHWEQPGIIAGLTFRSVVETAKDYLPKLRQLADVVVVAYHGGFARDLATGAPEEALTGENEGYELLESCGDMIDALVTGHQHREIAQSVLGVPVIQPGYRGANVGEIALELSREHRVVAGSATARLHSVASATADSEVLSAVAAVNAACEDWLDRPMGRVTGDMLITDAMAARLTEHPYIELINKIQMAATNAPIAGTALFNNEGTGFGAVITMRDILTNYIYPNTLAVLRLTGDELRWALERTAEFLSLDATGAIVFEPRYVAPKPQYYNYDMYEGIDYTLDISRPVGSRVTRLERDGKAVAPDETLEVAMNQYRGVGGGNYDMFGADKFVREVTVDMTELIASYLETHPVITASANHNFEVIGNR